MMFPKPRSVKQHTKTRKQNELYTQQRRKYLADHPWCEVCQSNQATEIHHKQGRGKYLLLDSTWLPVCQACHLKIHANPTWAKVKGFLGDRK